MAQDLNCEFNYYYHGADVADFRQIFKEEARDLNEQGYDVFWCINKFREDRRIKENLELVRGVGADFDNITLGDLMARFKFLPKPTMTVKTRSGFHLYWIFNEPKFISPEDYREFVETNLVPVGADPNAKDVCRVLRVPGFRYWQDSKKNRYTETQIFIEALDTQGPKWEFETLKRLFKKTPMPVEKPKSKSSSKIIRLNADAGFWEKCNQIPVEAGIEKLSGTSFVKGQVLSLKQQGKIKRLLVNGEASNGWIDEHGRFGSTYENTAGTLVNFLCFPEYGHSPAEVAKIFKEVFGVV